MKYSYRLLGAGFVIAFGFNAIAAPTTNIVVTASRIAQPVEAVPAFVSVVDSNALAESGAMTVDRAFRSLAGVDLQGGGLPGQMVRLNMRGMTSGYQSQRVLVLKDGRRLNDPFQGNVEFGLLPVYGIDRIEVVRGPASALYGSNAEGGVIQLFSRRATPGDPYGVMSAAFGEFDTQEYRIEQGAASGSLDYGVALGHQETGGYLDTEDGRPQDWRAESADANLGVNLGDAGALRLYTGAYDGEGRDASSDRESRRDYQQAEYRWADAGAAEWDTVARLYRNSFDETYKWFFPMTGRYDMQTLGAEGVASRWVGANNRVTAGGEFRQDSVDITDMGDSIDRSTDNSAGFVQDVIESGIWSFTAGLRYDYAADYGGFWSPRAGAQMSLTDEAEVFASINQAHMAPSLSDRYVNVIYQGMAFVGNPDLDPETVTAYELGFRARPRPFLSFQVSGFYQDLEDSFDFLMDPDGVFRIQNATRSTIWGGEGEARVTLPGGFSTFATLTYTEGTYDDFSTPEAEGNDIAFLAPWKSTAGVDYRTPAGSVHGIQARYSDARYADAMNEVKLDDAIVADWFSRVAMRPNLILTLRVQNLFDEDYMELPGVEQPGRWTMVGFEVPFM
jgi:outer membrane cobalamin receptor